MPHLWIEDSPCEWAALKLGGGSLNLTASPPGRCAENAAAPVALCVSSAKSDRPNESPSAWFLLSSREAATVWVNGLPYSAGAIRLMRHRDEIRLPDGRRIFFSEESPAEVAPFPGVGDRAVCPRCRLELAQGAASVRCPKCRVHHHQSEDRPCWTRTAACAVCGADTDLEYPSVWSPEEL